MLRRVVRRLSGPGCKILVCMGGMGCFDTSMWRCIDIDRIYLDIDTILYAIQKTIALNASLDLERR